MNQATQAPPLAEIAAALQEISRLKMRCHATELALFRISSQLRDLSNAATDVVQQLTALNEKFPIGDETPEGMERLVINAIRASVPSAATEDDDTIRRKFGLSITKKEASNG